MKRYLPPHRKLERFSLSVTLGGVLLGGLCLVLLADQADRLAAPFSNPRGYAVCSRNGHQLGCKCVNDLPKARGRLRIHRENLLEVWS
jgi:hypothetical protein